MDSDLDRSDTDCFPVTTDPADYLPRGSTERALAELRAAVCANRPAVLVGPPGVGKTLLLRRLGAEFERHGDAVYLGYTKLTQNELCSAALVPLGLPACDFPESELLLRSEELRGAGSALLLLLDEAATLPPETAAGLSALAAVSHGGLRLALAVSDETGIAELLEALGPEHEIAFLAPMDLGETDRYVRRRLARGLGPAAARAVDASAIATLHRASGGAARELHRTMQKLSWRSRYTPAGPDAAPYLRRSPGPRSERASRSPHPSARSEHRPAPPHPSD